MALLDNDIVLKACRYILVGEVLAALAPLGPPSILGSARFVLRHRLSRTAEGRSLSVKGQLDALLASAATIEPGDAEILLAAELQEEAQRRDLAFDSGESLLFAVLLFRSASCLVTGDKRAIAAAEALASGTLLPGDPVGKLVCLEQVMLAVLHAVGHRRLRARICAVPDADRALANCFGCAAEGCSADDTRSGLHSYSADVLAGAPRLLMPMAVLSTTLFNEDGVGWP